MKLINKYILQNLLAPLLYCLLGFILIFLIFDLFDNAGDFLEGNMTFRDILYYYALIIPAFMVQVVPACLMLSTLFCLATLTRHSEIIAMRACGINIHRIARPFIVVGIIGSLITHYINEVIVPTKGYQAAQFKESHEGGETVESVYLVKPLIIKFPKVGRDWFAESFDTRDLSMENVTMTQVLPDSDGSIRYTAKRVLRIDGRWWFMDVSIQKYDSLNNKRGAATYELQREMKDINDKPTRFISAAKTDVEFMSSSELRKFLRDNPKLSENKKVRTQVDMHHKLAMPWVCLIVAMLGIPLGAHSGRQGMFSCVLLTIGLFFGYYTLQITMEALAKGQHLTPAVGVWTPIGIFLAIAAAMIHRMR
ncbi:LptF/LptG family permease [Verrucomicrobiota bacterium]